MDMSERIKESKTKVITISEHDFIKSASKVINKMSQQALEESGVETSMSMLLIGTMFSGEISRELFKDVNTTSQQNEKDDKPMRNPFIFDKEEGPEIIRRQSENRNDKR